MNDQQIRNRIVTKMLRKQIIGSKVRTIDALTNMFLPSHDQGKGRQLIKQMIADKNAPLSAYGGGNRENVRLTSAEDAVAYLKKHNGEIPFGYE